ncbi:MAG: hypothetical protein DRJ40_01685 [Thermoprotei archaeon]|nr:MAG: hypothetical protein DRJ40_01685 [Thermoprotei archaeon]
MPEVEVTIEKDGVRVHLRGPVDAISQILVSILGTASVQPPVGGGEQKEALEDPRVRKLLNQIKRGAIKVIQLSAGEVYVDRVEGKMYVKPRGWSWTTVTRASLSLETVKQIVENLRNASSISDVETVLWRFASMPSSPRALTRLLSSSSSKLLLVEFLWKVVRNELRDVL